MILNPLLCRLLRSTLALLLTNVWLSGVARPITLAAPVTFFFEAELDHPVSISLQAGQRAIGSYTFELDASGVVNSPYNTVANYADAITDFNITLDGIGEARGTSGSISLSNPIPGLADLCLLVTATMHMPPLLV